MNGSPALRRELIELIGRLEDVAHAVVPAAAAYLAELALSDDHQPQRVAEQLGELQDDLAAPAVAHRGRLGRRSAPGGGAATVATLALSAEAAWSVMVVAGARNTLCLLLFATRLIGR
jgi:hypothetical protein